MISLFQGNTGFLSESLEIKYNESKEFDFYLQLQSMGEKDAFQITAPIITGKVEYTHKDHLLGFAYKFGEARTKVMQPAANHDVLIAGYKLFYQTKYLAIIY